MNLQDYIQRIKLWIDKQYFIIRHYKIIISVFLVLFFFPIHNSLIFVHNVETYLLQTLCVLFMLNGINYNMVYEKMYNDVNLLQNI